MNENITCPNDKCSGKMPDNKPTILILHTIDNEHVYWCLNCNTIFTFREGRIENMWRLKSY